MWVHELMKANKCDQTDENFWFPQPEVQGNENEHTPKQRRILKEVSELIEKDELGPTKDQSQGRNSLTCSNEKGYSLKGTTDSA